MNKFIFCFIKLDIWWSDDFGIKQIIYSNMTFILGKLCT